MGDWVRRRKHAGGAAVGCAVALAVSQGCGTADRPSAFGSSIAARAEAGPAQTIDIDASSTYEPMCNLGPEGGVCACVDEPLAGDVPNLYFVLDRSGSMAEMGKWSNVQIALDQLVVALGPRANIGAAVFPDPSNGACSTGVEVMPTRRGDAPAGKRGTTDAILVTTLSRIPAAGGTPTAATLASLVPKLAALPGQTYVVLATDGGPNCNAFAACDATTCTYNIDDVTDCPPGGPPNCCTDPGTGPEACLDSEPTIQAVAELAAAGIPVYVIGVPGSAPYADLLDALAVTGERRAAAPPTSTRPTAMLRQTAPTHPTAGRLGTTRSTRPIRALSWPCSRASPPRSPGHAPST